jgi:acyl dehydratase
MPKAGPPTEADPPAHLDRVVIDVERGKIAEFTRATHTQDAVHLDEAAAAAAGYPNVLATPTHVVVAGHQRNQIAFVAALGLAIERVVVGSVEWDYARPLVAGDRLTGTRRVVDDTVREGKRGGSMRLVTLDTEWVDGTGAVAVRQRETLIERSA